MGRRLRRGSGRQLRRNRSPRNLDPVHYTLHTIHVLHDGLRDLHHVIARDASAQRDNPLMVLTGHVPQLRICRLPQLIAGRSVHTAAASKSRRQCVAGPSRYPRWCRWSRRHGQPPFLGALPENWPVTTAEAKRHPGKWDQITSIILTEAARESQ